MSEQSEGAPPPAQPLLTLSSLERELSVLVRRSLGTLWGKRDDGGLDRWIYALLVRLSEEGPLRVGEVARRFGIDKSTASRHLGRMEEQGLVEGITDENDARSLLMKVTPGGAEHLAQRRAERLKVLRPILAAWPEEDRSELTRLLGRLNRELDQAGEL